MNFSTSPESLYNKALCSYLLTKYTQAANTCNKAIVALKTDDTETLRLNIWTLYLNIASTLLVGASQSPQVKLFGIEQQGDIKSFRDVCNGIWSKVVNEGYQGRIELVDARLVSAYMILNLKLNQYNLGREITESWFASLPDLVLDDISNGRQSAEGYVEVVMLYTSRILPAMNDFESAKMFLEYNSVLSESKKKQLQSLVQEQHNHIEKEAIHKKKLEEAAKLAAENKKQEEEAKKLEMARQERIKTLEKQKQQEAATVAELSSKKEKKEKIREDHNTVISPLPQQIPSALDHNLNVVKNWMGQMTAKGAASYATILIIMFALLSLLRGQRGRLSVALQTLMNKFWQTIKMGTKVTYI